MSDDSRKLLEHRNLLAPKLFAGNALGGSEEAVRQERGLEDVHKIAENEYDEELQTFQIFYVWRCMNQ